MKSIEVWDVQLWDGGDRHVHAYFIDRAAVTEQQLMERHKHCVARPVLITVFESFQEVDDNSHKALLRSAWHKLSPQERQALKLEEPK